MQGFAPVEAFAAIIPLAWEDHLVQQVIDEERPLRRVSSSRSLAIPSWRRCQRQELAPWPGAESGEPRRWLALGSGCVGWRVRSE